MTIVETWYIMKKLDNLIDKEVIIYLTDGSVEIGFLKQQNDDYLLVNNKNKVLLQFKEKQVVRYLIVNSIEPKTKTKTKKK